MLIKWRYVVLLVCTGLVSLPALCADADGDNSHVVLISLDGFRHDYIEKHGATSLARLAAQGVRSEKMRPVYPANTFPNHLSIITGRRPVNHGIVNNDFYDKQRPDGDSYAHYSMGKGAQDSTWITALPLWNLAEFHGKKAATFFWPESDARLNGALPSYHFHYSKYADYQQRVDQIVAWLQLPDSQRPRFIAGYFSLVDSVGHNFGPDAPQTQTAVKQVDRLIGQLHERLSALPFAVNLIVVSDHGMASLSEQAVIEIESLPIDKGAFIAEVAGAHIMLYAKNGVGESEIEQQRETLQAASRDRFRVLNRAQRAGRHFSAGPRTGDIVLEVSPPARFASREDHYSSLGGHGYLPEHSDMGALFVASGPAFKQGVRLPAFSNLEIYPAIAEILGLPLLSDIDGNIQVLRDGLQPSRSTE